MNHPLITIQWLNGTLLKVFIYGVVLATAAVFLLSFFSTRENDIRLTKALSAYEAGTQAKTIYEREIKFNEALDEYLSLDNEYHPILSDGKLYYNIGNTFFQLMQYPQSILYYEKAKLLLPREKALDINLTHAKAKLNLDTSQQDVSFSKFLAFHDYLSLPERLKLFLCTALTFLFMISLNIWIKSFKISKSLIVILVPLAILSASLIYSRYFSPLEAILIQPVELRINAGKQYAKVTKDIVAAGSKVEVLGSNPSGTWLKVITPKGQVGYAEQDKIRMIGV